MLLLSINILLILFASHLIFSVTLQKREKTFQQILTLAQVFFLATTFPVFDFDDISWLIHDFSMHNIPISNNRIWSC